MHDLTTLVWVVLLIIGVVSSMIANIRKQMRQQQQAAPRQPVETRALQEFFARQPPQAAQTQPPPQVVRMQPPQVARTLPQAPTPPPAARAQAPAPTPPPPAQVPHAAPSAAHPRSPRVAFAVGRHALVRAIIASEVLGKPRALRDE